MKCPKCGHDFGDELLPARCPDCAKNLSRIQNDEIKQERLARLEMNRKHHRDDAAYKLNRKKYQIIAVSLMGVFVLAMLVFAFRTGLIGNVYLEDYRGFHLDYVTAQLEKQGCTVDSEQIYADKPDNYVVEMEPAPGALIRKGMKVHLKVSIQRKMPDLVGKSKDDAEELLKEQGLTAKFVEIPSTKPEGEVLSQNIKANNPVTLNRNIELEIARPYTVPDVVGKKRTEAVALIEQEGLKPLVVFTYNKKADPGVVISVKPEVGKKVKPKSTVLIFVVWGEDKASKENVSKILNIVYNCDPMNPANYIGSKLKPLISPTIEIDGKKALDCSDRDVWYAMIKGDKRAPSGVTDQLEKLNRSLVSINSITMNESGKIQANITVKWYWDRMGSEYIGVTSTDTRNVSMTFADDGGLESFNDPLSDMPVYTIEH